MTFPPPAIRILLVLLVVIGAAVDLRQRRIPNWLTLPGIVIAIALNTFLYESDGLLLSAKGLALAFGVYFALYLLRGMGAGDVKLMAAVGAAVGAMNWFGILLLTSIAGALAGLALVAVKGRMRSTFRNLFLILMSLRRGRAPYQEHPEIDVRSEEAVRLPHAAMIAAGTLSFLAAGAIWAPQ